MMTKKLSLFLIISFFSVFSIHGQNLHFLVAADKNRPDIGRGCELDYYKMTSFFNTVAQSIGFKLVTYEASGSQFNADNIANQTAEMQAGADDIIVTYISSHGENTGTEFPCFIVNSTCISTETLHKEMKAKNARLCITISDCCNIIPKKSSMKKSIEVIEELKTDGKSIYSELFLESKGDIIATSSLKGQYSYSDSDQGSYFTRYFSDALTNAVNFSKNPNWESIFVDSKERLGRMSFEDGPQIPFWQINLQNNEKEIEPDPIEPVESDVNAYLNNLCNETIALAKRKDLLKKYQQFFMPKAYVQIYVGKTRAEIVPIEDLINKLLLNANEIVSVNIIEKKSKTTQNKQQYAQITIQEIWK